MIASDDLAPSSVGDQSIKITQSQAPFWVMAKPISATCNLDCKYCYYLDRSAEHENKKVHRMDDTVLECFIRDYISSVNSAEVIFTWQGGEPTLLGLEYFQHIIDLQNKYCPSSKKIKNLIQTNGILLNDSWAGFFKTNNFLVGLSIDGPPDIHDYYRVTRKGMPTCKPVMEGLRLLQKHEVEFNTLTVVNRHNEKNGRDVYRFLRDLGVQYMQFIPAVERSFNGLELSNPPVLTRPVSSIPVTPWSVTREGFGDFMIEVFDEWIRSDVKQISVQLFEVLLGLWARQPSTLCVFGKTCGQGLAMEANGDLFSCDHYVYPEYRLGNITESPMTQLVKSTRQQKFGRDKFDTLSGQCLSCEYQFACYGGCPKYRFIPAKKGEAGLNYLCTSYKKIFAHIDPYLREMVTRLGLTHARGNLKSRMPGRNKPCLCGSGLKLKKCCG